MWEIKKAVDRKGKKKKSLKDTQGAISKMVRTLGVPGLFRS